MRAGADVLALCAIVFVIGTLVAVSVCRILDHLSTRGQQRLVCWVVAMLAVFLGAMWRPFDSPLVYYVRALTDDLSVPTIVLSGAHLGSRLLGTPTASREQQRALMWTVVFGGMILFPATFLPLGVDPYEWGYSREMNAVVLALASVAWCIGARLTATAMALSVLANVVGLYRATNLWNYLIDPFLSGYAAAVLIGRGISVLRRATWRVRAFRTNRPQE